MRQLLIWIRKKKTTIFTPICTAVAILGIISGVLIDRFVPYNFWYNMIRAIVASAVAFSIFSLSYISLTTNRIVNKIETPTLRESFSQKQRINLSLIGAGILIFGYIFLVKPGNWIFTFYSMLMILYGITAAAFIRYTRNEFLQAAAGIEDERDIKSQAAIEELLSEAVEGEEDDNGEG